MLNYRQQSVVNACGVARTRLAVRWSIVLLGALALFSTQAMAQGETTSAIVGQVTANAAIAGAAVTVTNRETGATRKAITDGAGRFDFPQLMPGTYSVSVEAEGFKPAQNENVVSGLGQKQSVDFTSGSRKRAKLSK